MLAQGDFMAQFRVRWYSRIDRVVSTCLAGIAWIAAG